MKKKFEDNVADFMPKTKTEEPSLPWKIEETDLAGIATMDQEFTALSSGESPLKTRPVFLAILVITVFLAALYMVAVMAGENENVKLGILAREKEAAELQVDLDKVSAEKVVLEKSSVQLEKRIGDLAAQKELFTAVLESLTKKNDVIPTLDSRISQEPASTSVETAPETVSTDEGAAGQVFSTITAPTGGAVSDGVENVTKAQ